MEFKLDDDDDDDDNDGEELVRCLAIKLVREWNAW